MSVPAREPRLPLEPEEYPLYRPPRRFGCSGLTIITIITMAAFAFLFTRVAPDMAAAITDFPRRIFQQGTPEADATAGPGGFATQTAISLVVPPTAIVILPTPTPVYEYVKVANTGTQNGARLRKDPRQGSANVMPELVGEGAVLRVIGEDVKDTANPSIIWRHVQLLPDDLRKGYIRNIFLQPAANPNP